MEDGQATSSRPSNRANLCACFSQSVAPTNSPLTSPSKPLQEAGKPCVLDVTASNGAHCAQPMPPAQPDAAAPSTSRRSVPGSLRAEDACVRWAVNSAQWNPVTHGEEWLFLLDLLPEEDQKQVESFRFKDDQKRALLSRLLQRRCVNVGLGVPWGKVRIKRTKAKKPFVVGVPDRQHAPNFNFNVSHEGDYVVLAAEPVCIVGVDVAAPQQIRAARPARDAFKRASSMEDLQQTFQRQFTAHEWETINGAGQTTKEKEDEFRRHWSLKEALVKARGDGLGFELGKAEFRFDEQNRNHARVLIEGRAQPRWRFVLQELGNGHWVSVARGPLEDIVDAWQEFSGTLLNRCSSEQEFQAALDAPSPPFSMLRVVDLLPEELRAAYRETGADAV